MLTILQKIFIKNEEPAIQRKKIGILCGAFGIFLNIALFITKYIAGYLSGSIAIMADAFNNLSDAGSSLINIFGFVFAGQKPDPEHPFGHGRIEYVSGFIVSILILFMGYELAKSSIDKILHPTAIEFSTVSLVILLIAVGVKLYMALYNHRIGNRINSASMKATTMDSLSDSIATAAVLITTLLSHFFHWKIDGWVGMAVALLILYAGFNAAKETLAPLLGQAPDPELVQSIHDIVTAHPIVIGVHDMIVHDYGPGRRIISLHAEVPCKSDIITAHDEIDNIEIELKEKLSCEATIHLDPIDTDNEELSMLRTRISEFLKTIHPKMNLHDLRMVNGITHTNLIFDVVVPYDVSLKSDEIEQMVSDFVRNQNEIYRTVITIEHSYT